MKILLEHQLKILKGADMPQTQTTTLAKSLLRRFSIAILSVYVLGSGARAAAATDLTGNWRLDDVFCSNPAYKSSPEEQAFRDAIHHKGSMWTDDVLAMTNPSRGSWSTTFTAEGASCIESQELTFTEIEGGRIRLDFSAGTAHTQEPGRDPNVTMTCDPVHDAYEIYDRVEMTAEGFDFIIVNDAACGDLHYRFLKLKK